MPTLTTLSPSESHSAIVTLFSFVSPSLTILSLTVPVPFFVSSGTKTKTAYVSCPRFFIAENGSTICQFSLAMVSVFHGKTTSTMSPSESPCDEVRLISAR